VPHLGIYARLPGVIHGASSEFGFGAMLYSRWSISVAIAAAAAAAVGEWLHDMPVYYATLDLGQQLVIGVFMLLSAVIIAGIGSWFLMPWLAQTGALGPFACGRAQQRRA